jgi:hypothetical protein
MVVNYTYSHQLIQTKIRVHACSDMVLTAHRTLVASGLVATTVETVRSAGRTRVPAGPRAFPAPVEELVLAEHPGGRTELTYRGELGTTSARSGSGGTGTHGGNDLQRRPNRDRAADRSTMAEPPSRRRGQATPRAGGASRKLGARLRQHPTETREAHGRAQPGSVRHHRPRHFQLAAVTRTLRAAGRAPPESASR